MTQSFIRFLLCAVLLGASLTVSSAHAQDAADAGVPQADAAVHYPNTARGRAAAAAAAQAAAEAQAAADAQAAAAAAEAAAAAQAAAEAQAATDARVAAETQAAAEAQAAADAQAAAAAEAQAAADAAAAEQARVAAEAAAAAAATPPEAPKRVWRNSIFTVSPWVTTYTFSEGAQLTYDPTFALNFTLSPRFYLLDTLYLRVSEDLSVEVTQSDSDTTTRQPLLSDMRVDLMRPALIKTSGFVLSAGLRVSLPVSIASRFANRIMGTSLITASSYDLPEATHLTVGFDFSYTHNWNSTNTATHFAYADNAGEGATICPSGADGCEVGGPTNATESFSFGPSLEWAPIDTFSLSASYSWLPRLGGPLGTQTIETATGPVVLRDDKTHWRVGQAFSISASYQTTPWLGLSLAYAVQTSQLNTNGTLRNPLSNPDMTLEFDATVTLDQLYDAALGDGDDLTPEQQRLIRQGEASADRRGASF